MAVPAQPTRSSPLLPWSAVRTMAIGALGVVSAFVVELSIPAVVLILLGFLSLPERGDRLRRAACAALFLGAIGAAVGLVRFAVTKAIVGIAEGGQRAATNSALFRLREILIAQDAMRKHAFIDPDGDGVGSAAFVTELTTHTKLRAPEPLSASLLNYRFKDVVETPLGPALGAASHLFIVCLPRKGGGFTARPGEAVDEEGAERRFVAYAWPAERVSDVQSALFLDEHERILTLDSSDLPFHGASSPPPCDAALSGKGGSWRPWKGKKPRGTLPGDR